MAPETLVIDASVGVKWFSDKDEASVPQARSILKAHAAGEIKLLVPDLFFHEICNALVFKKNITQELLLDAIATLFDLDLGVFPVDVERLSSAVRIARKANVTEYDACYIALAIENRCPLITANPRHQKSEIGCRVVHIDHWNPEK